MVLPTLGVFLPYLVSWIPARLSNLDGKQPPNMDNDEWARQALIKTIIWHTVNEATGWAKQGALWGGSKMPDAWKDGLTGASCKQPMVEQVTLLQRLWDRNAPDVWAYEKEAGIFEKWLPWTFGDK